MPNLVQITAAALRRTVRALSKTAGVNHPLMTTANRLAYPVPGAWYHEQMAKDKNTKCSFRVKNGTLGEACIFADGLLTRKDINDETAKETLLVFEALMQKLIDWGLDENTDLEVSGTERLGDFRIKVGFEGKVFARGEEDLYSVEDRILDAYDDRVGYSYRSGYNEISISVSRSHRTAMFACFIASLLAVIAYIPMSMMLDVNEQHYLLDGYVFPIETMYANALLMIGAPMTFFSLLKNLTDTYVVSQKSSGIRQLQLRTLGTSAFAILLAFAAISIISVAALSNLGGTSSEYSGSLDRSFADIVTSLIPPSIFQPFEAISPIPLIIVALLCTYALCSAGKYFNTLRDAMMACYTLFSRMLHVLIAVLPVFCFLAIMDVLLDSGYEGALRDLLFILAIYLSLVLLFATYAIRLRVHGVKVIPFVKKLAPLLRENYSIGSAIGAAPYNIRYCSRTFKMNREMLERDLPVLAETNLDGNCFIIMSLALMFVFATGTELSWINVIALAALILFLSYGAPNQPGSILIGTLIVTMYLNSFDVVCFAIFSEAFLGSAQNLVNVIGDIVLVAIEDSKEKARTEGA